MKIFYSTLILCLMFFSNMSYSAWPFSEKNEFVQKNMFNSGYLKGFNIGEIKDYDDRYIEEVSNTGANILRVIVPFTFCDPIGDELKCIYEVKPEIVEKVKKMSLQFKEKNIKIIISAFFYEKSKGDFWKNKMLQNGMSESWKYFADQIKDDKNIAALELYYSPDSSGMVNKYKSSNMWSVAGYHMIKSIRSVDLNHLIIFQVPEGNPENIEGLLDMNDDKIIFGFDMFYPTQITLQGINNNEEYTYPLGAEYGLDPLMTGKNTIIDEKELEKYLSPIIDFRNKGNTVFISSWGIVRYAPQGSTYRYVKDILSIFTENKLSWAYYGFRINKYFDPFIAGDDINDTARTPEASIITLLRENMKLKNK